MTSYSHRIIGLGLEQVLETRPDGFVHKGKHYSWQDIESIVVHWRPAFLSLAIFVLTLGAAAVWSTAHVHLSDGKCIYLSAPSLVKNGQRAKRGCSRFYTWENPVFTELLALLESKRRAN